MFSLLAVTPVSFGPGFTTDPLNGGSMIMVPVCFMKYSGYWLYFIFFQKKD
jgi:hypothetical protein